MNTTKVCTPAGFWRLSTGRALICEGEFFHPPRNQWRICEVGLVLLHYERLGAFMGNVILLLGVLVITYVPFLSTILLPG